MREQTSNPLHRVACGIISSATSTQDHSHGVRLGRLVGLRAEISGSGAALGEEAGEHWLDERAEDDLSTAVPIGQSRARQNE